MGTIWKSDVPGFQNGNSRYTDPQCIYYKKYGHINTSDNPTFVDLSSNKPSKTT
jgi:hypothetical protein